MRKLFEEACRYYLFQDPEVLYQRFKRALLYSFLPALVFVLLPLLKRLAPQLPLPAFLIHITLITLALPAIVLFLYMKPYRDYKSHLKRLAEESYWAVLIADAYAQAGLSTIQIANRLKEKELTLPHVNFALSYNGIPIWGLGAKVRIYIGEGGGVVGFIGRFWEVRSAGEVSILRPEEAVQKLKELGYGGSVPRKMVSRVIVKYIELVYYAPRTHLRNLGL